eukprot:m.432495 g.432495  ORF g.432495 m.432495 type:complete len:282 (+) comp17443_c0_seq1:45-890(+)
MARVASVLVLATVAFGQDTNPCASYDINTGKGVCNGVNVDIGGVICAGGFDPNTCKASWQNGGQTETYYFKGTPTGLPAGPSIQSDCSATDFPDNGGIAMAQTYQDAQGNPAGCYPAADVVGSTLAYTAGNGGTGVASVTIDFNVHTDAGGTQRDGFVKITCVKGGPTSGFAYTTVGDTGHQSQYEIDTTADCEAASGGPPSGHTGGEEKKEETGWVLVGLLLGGFAIYFAAGYTYNWKVKGAEPSERVPNKEFWVGLPGLIKDGFRFTTSKVRGQEYQPL